MNKIYKIYLVFTFALALVACKKEYKGLTDWKPINETSLAFTDTVFTVLQFDTLKVQPTITQSIGSNALKYEWIAYFTSTPASGVNTPKIISTEKNLDKQILLVPGAYFLQYKVTDTLTGIFATRRFSLTVNGAYWEGWLLPNVKNGNSLLSFVRIDGKVDMNPYFDVNAANFTGTIKGAKCGIIKNLNEINVFTSTETYVLSAEDFTLLRKSQDMYETMPASYNNPFYACNSANTDQFIINNGKVITTIAPGTSNYIPGKYSIIIPIVPTGGTNYDLVPAMVSPQYGTLYNIFFDNIGMRFLYMNSNARTLTRFAATPGQYNMDSVGKSMVAIELGKVTPGTSTTWRGEYYAIMKDNTNRFYCYTILINQTPRQKIGSFVLMNATDIALATSYTGSSRAAQLYYSVQNKIYLYDVASNTSRLFYTFPSGTIVKDIEMYKSKGSFKTNLPLYNTRIAAATYNGTEGELYYFDLTATGDLSGSTYAQKFGGFGDILSLDYKNPKE